MTSTTCPNLLKALDRLPHADELVKHDADVCRMKLKALNRIVDDVVECYVPFLMDLEVPTEESDVRRFLAELNALLETKGYVIIQALLMPAVDFDTTCIPQEARVVVAAKAQKHDVKRLDADQQRDVSKSRVYWCKAKELF